MPVVRERPSFTSARFSLGIALQALRETAGARPRQDGGPALNAHRLSQAEAGEIDIPFSMLVAIAEALDLPLYSIFCQFERAEHTPRLASEPQARTLTGPPRCLSRRIRWRVAEPHACLGRAVRLKRSHKELDRCRLGHLSGLGYSYLLALEHGRVNSVFSELLALTSALGISLSSLVLSFENQSYEFLQQEEQPAAVS